MSNSQRKKKLSAIEQYLLNQQEKLDFQEQDINQPINEDVQGL